MPIVFSFMFIFMFITVFVRNLNKHTELRRRKTVPVRGYKWLWTAWVTGAVGPVVQREVGSQYEALYCASWHTGR